MGYYNIIMEEKMKSTYCIGGRVIAVHSLHGRVHDYCRDYRCDGTPELAVSITQADIDWEREKSAREDAAEGRPVRHFPDDYLEELAVYRKIAEWMPGQDTFLFHGSVVAVDGAAYLFTASSGTGKSTHTRLWRELLGDRAVMVNDDKPLIHVTDAGKAVVYGTPWNGKHRLGCNMEAPLKAICLLERGEENRIRRIDRMEAYPMLLQQMYRPASSIAMKQTLALIDRMKVAYYRLACNMDISAAELAYETMKR